jgi:acyl-CoA thioesterase FadM
VLLSRTNIMAPFNTVFDTRGYELDAEARVPAHMWLRYMEHLRWEHTVRNSPEISALFRKGDAIVVVAQTLRIIRDIGVAIPLRGTLWIGRTGRTSVVFSHAFRHADDGGLLAAGNIIAVYLNRGVPAPLPRHLFRVDPDPFALPELTPAKFPETTAGPFEYSYRVRAGDLDFLGHMNQASYAALFDDTRQAAAGRNAYGPGGLGLGRIRFLHIEYLHSAMIGENLTIATWPIGNDPLNLVFAMRRNDTLISRAIMTLGSDRQKSKYEK